MTEAIAFSEQRAMFLKFPKPKGTFGDHFHFRRKAFGDAVGTDQSLHPRE
jgi:hypothetical protein